MTLSPMVAEWVAAYEQEHGCLKVGGMFTELGKKDAQKGKTPYPANVFPALAIEAFRMDVDEDRKTVQAVANLLQSDYLDGYQGEGTTRTLMDSIALVILRCGK